MHPRVHWIVSVFLFDAFLIVGIAGAQLTGEWRGAQPPSSPVFGPSIQATADSSAPAPHAAPYTSMAGDDDGFGFGKGWVPPNSCEVFDNREPEDLGVFDQRQPGSTYDSICDFAGGWSHSFTPPPGGAGSFTIHMRILGGQGSTAYCWASPCGCVTPAQQVFLNGVEYPFFGDPGCGTTTGWSMTWTGAEAAAIAASGSMSVYVKWGQNAFAIDYATVTMQPSVEVAVADGNNQRGVIGNPVEKKLAVKLTSPDPSFNVAGMAVTFEIVATPANSSGHAVGADDNATATTYSAVADGSGIARATLVLGNKQGDYAIRVKSPLSLTGATADFTATAVKPASTAILKDSLDAADKAPSYAVSAQETTAFYMVGLDAAGAKVGPIRSNWAVSAGGNPATRGDGTVSPTAGSITSTLQPSKVGHVVLSANPLVSGIATAKADLFLTALYVDVDGSFDMAAPVDQTAQFVPGALLDGSSVNPTVMASGGQAITLHLLTGPGSKGTVTFSLPDAEVSKWRGIAMNFPVGSGDATPDLVFSGGAASIAVPFDAAGDTSTTLYVRDYAAIGTIHVSVKSGKKTYPLEPRRLPRDANGNEIADAGWRAESAAIPDSALGAGRDEDDNPVMRLALPPNSGGLVGDNLTNFEEYRGFVLNGVHRRTNPFHKDYFVEAADFSNDIRYAFPSLPTSTYLTTTADATASLVLNMNWEDLPGSTDSAPDGHTDQKIHRVRRSDLASATVVGQTYCEGLRYFDSPCVPNNGTESVIYMYVVNQSAANAGVTDPNVIAEYRRSTVAHECGHGLNLFHNLSPSCLMYGSGSWTDIATTFCGPVDTTLVDCVPCVTASPTGDTSLEVTSFFETDTLRIKEDQRP